MILIKKKYFVGFEKTSFYKFIKYNTQAISYKKKITYTHSALVPKDNSKHLEYSILKHSAIIPKYNNKDSIGFTLTHNKDSINILGTKSYVNLIKNISSNQILIEKNIDSPEMNSFTLKIKQLCFYEFLIKNHISCFDNSKILKFGTNSNRILIFNKKFTNQYMTDKKYLDFSDKIAISEKDFLETYTLGAVTSFNTYNSLQILESSINKNNLNIEECLNY